MILTVLLLAAATFAQTGGPPVAVSACSGGITSIELVELADYHVTVRDTANVAADEIRLAIPYGRRRTATFDVRGVFPPNVDVAETLRKTLSGGLYAYDSSQNDCRIDYVHFIDGTSWPNGS